jgi:hypothetical protein
MSPRFSGSKKKLSKKISLKAGGKHEVKIEATCSYETSVDF